MAHALKRGSWVLATVRAASACTTLFVVSGQVAAAGTAGTLRKYPKNYVPRTWTDRVNLMKARIRAAFPPVTSPVALTFAVASWACYALLVFCASHVCASALVASGRIAFRLVRGKKRAVHAEPVIEDAGTDDHVSGGAGYSSLVAKVANLIGKEARELIRSDQTVNASMGEQAVTHAANAWTATSGRVSSARNASVRVVRRAIAAAASDASRVSRYVFGYVAIAVYAAAMAIACIATRTLDVRPFDWHPIDALACPQA